MNITRTSRVSGVTRSREIDITPEQLASWENGTLIQNAAPHLSVSDREFIMSGITDDEWDSIFGKSSKTEGEEDESL